VPVRKLHYSGNPFVLSAAAAAAALAAAVATDERF